MKQYEIKGAVLRLLSSIDRHGIDAMVEYMNYGSDFFEAPASMKHHLAHVGGLAKHSLNVYNVLGDLVELHKVDVSEDEIRTVALLHDICKANYYVPEEAWRKDERGKWESYVRWGVEDQLPLGHGEKSLYVIGKFLKLTDSEAAAIRWHMGCWTAGVGSDYRTTEAFNAAEMYPLVTLLFVADVLATKIVEKG